MSRRGVVCRVPVFQPGARLRFKAGSEILTYILGLWDCVCVLCVLSCIASGGDPGIVLTTHSGRPSLLYLSSVLVNSLLSPPPTGI